MNQLIESFVALKKMVEKNEAQAEKKYTDLLKNKEEMQKKMEAMQTSSDGDNKFDQIIQNFPYLTWSMETIKQPNKSTFILGETSGQAEHVKFHPSINMLLTCHFLIRH
jgi:bacillopeptidase F (M6 metalloprotease family)